MAEQQNRTLTDQFMLRLPDGMRDRIKAAAYNSKRSMNAEILETLEEKYPPVNPDPNEIIQNLTYALEGVMSKQRQLDMISKANDHLESITDGRWHVVFDESDKISVHITLSTGSLP